MRGERRGGAGDGGGLARARRGPWRLAAPAGDLLLGGRANAFATLAGCPAVAVPCGFDRYGRPVGLQVVAPPRQGAKALQVPALFERLAGLDRMLPIDPRPGMVPPDA